MQHTMRLRHGPFLKIAAREKTVELRLFDEKRALVRTGDTVLFTDTDTGEQALCAVTGLRPFRNFEALYAHYDKRSLGYEENAHADPNDMRAYYSESDIVRYGVLAIEIRLLPGKETL